MEKSTYSGRQVNNYVYFAFYGDAYNPEQITNTLGLNPTTVKHKKDPVPVRTSWKLQVTSGSSPNFKTSLEELIATLTPLIEEINTLKSELSLETKLMFVMDIDIDPDASMPYFALNHKSIQFLYQTGTSVDFDLYKADTKGLILR